MIGDKLYLSGTLCIFEQIWHIETKKGWSEEKEALKTQC